MHFLQKFLATLLSIPGELTYNFERHNLVSGDITSGETDFWATWPKVEKKNGNYKTEMFWVLDWDPFQRL